MATWPYTLSGCHCESEVDTLKYIGTENENAGDQYLVDAGKLAEVLIHLPVQSS